MDQPIKSNRYQKYVIQIGWWQPAPQITMAVLAQEVLSKTKKDGQFLMSLLYPESLGLGMPFLCPIVMELTKEDFERMEEEKDMDDIEKQIKETQRYELPKDNIKRIDLVYPN